MHFDARAAKLLQPGQHLVVDGCPGLRLVASATTKTWTYRYKAADGRMKQVAFGHWPAVPVSAAAAQWQALRDQRGAGIDPGQAKREAKQAEKSFSSEPAVYAVRDLVADYITGHLLPNRNPDGAESARRALVRMLDEDPDFAAMPAESVSRSHAFNVLDARKEFPMKTAKLKSLIGAAWDYALDAGRVDGNTPNWWRAVMKGRLKSKGKIMGGVHVGTKRRLLTSGEVATLLRWLGNMHQTARDVIVLYLWTCTRGGEILKMRPEHVGMEGDVLWWTIPKALTKNEGHAQAEDLRVPLFGHARAVVERRLKAVGKSGRIFDDAKGGEYTQRDFSTYIYNLQPYSEKVTLRKGDGLVIPVTNWSPHNLRRTGRTLLAALGCPDEVGEAILGHMPAEMVATYNAYSYDVERVEWLAKLAGYLERL